MGCKKPRVILTDSMLGRIKRNVDEIIRQIKKGNLPLGYVLYALKLLREGNLELPDPLKEYDTYLLNLPGQRALLLEYDEKYWGGRYRDQITALELHHHGQSFRKCAIIIVSGRTVAETMRMWLKILEDRHGSTFEDQVTEKYTVRLERAAAKASPGVSIMYFDFGAHYMWGRPVTASAVRDDSRTYIGKLPGVEVLAAMALQHHVQDLLDGRRMPTMLLAGLSAHRDGEEARSIRLARVPSKGSLPHFVLEAVGVNRALGGTAAPRRLDPPAASTEVDEQAA